MIFNFIRIINSSINSKFNNNIINSSNTINNNNSSNKVNRIPLFFQRNNHNHNTISTNNLKPTNKCSKPITYSLNNNNTRPLKDNPAKCPQTRKDYHPNTEIRILPSNSPIELRLKRILNMETITENFLTKKNLNSIEELLQTPQV